MSVWSVTFAQEILEKSWVQLNQRAAVDYLTQPNLLVDFVTKSDPLIQTLFTCCVIAFLCWFFSILTNNYSWVDKSWSIIPFVFAWQFYYSAKAPSPRLLAMALLPTIWGLRLSFNFWRKGGYAYHGEDYRWKIIQAMVHPILYQIFNATFIAPYQCLLLWLIVSPMFIAVKLDTPLNILDYIAIGLFAFFLLIETTADQQQWNFHIAKSAASEGKSYDKSFDPEIKRGFRSSGLFAISRHPNFLCEMSIWWSYYLFSVAASSQWLNWTIVGTILLTLLFQGSTNFTESITAKKYPQYKQYQNITSRLLPWFPSGDFQDEKDVSKKTQ